jgi:hypothetical protein
LPSLPEDVSWALAVDFEGSMVREKMELVIVIVVLVVAGAMIPGNPKIRFFR